MRILGVDPALTVTGYGVIEFRKGRIGLVEAGVIKTTVKQDLAGRLERIYRATEKLISDTHPDIMVLEKIYAHYRHPATAFHLGQARGVIYLAGALAKIPVVEYGATRIKKAIVGQGLASKQQVQKMVAHSIGLEKLPAYTDVTDALALAIAHGYITRV
jgi:crossover junction endodeoxyribonuclease RuvC